MDLQRRICFINGSGTGSTGSIVNVISKSASKYGFSSLFVAHSSPKSDFEGQFINALPHKCSYLFSRIPTYLFDGDGFRSNIATERVLKSVRSFKPGILHIHNPHSSFININTIVDYALDNSVKIIWTLHDAWTLTGRCGTPFSCQQWKTGCKVCMHKDFYPKVLFSQSNYFYKQKHCLINRMIEAGSTFVSPSKWLQNLFIHSYPKADVSIIRNGIDKSVFTPIGDVCQKILQFSKCRKIIGGTSLSPSKGGFYFEKLAAALDPDRYCVVAIGAEKENEVSKNYLQMRALPSKKEMAAFYRSINTLVSPTQSDNFPTTHLESISCGTPVLTFDVGGASEMIRQGINGFSIALNDEKMLISTAIAMLNKKWDRQIVSSTQENSSDEMAKNYIRLYESKLIRRQ